MSITITVIDSNNNKPITKTEICFQLFNPIDKRSMISVTTDKNGCFQLDEKYSKIQIKPFRFGDSPWTPVNDDLTLKIDTLKPLQKDIADCANSTLVSILKNEDEFYNAPKLEKLNKKEEFYGLKPSNIKAICEELTFPYQLIKVDSNSSNKPFNVNLFEAVFYFLLEQTKKIAVINLEAKKPNATSEVIELNTDLTIIKAYLAQYLNPASELNISKESSSKIPSDEQIENSLKNLRQNISIFVIADTNKKEEKKDFSTTPIRIQAFTDENNTTPARYQQFILLISPANGEEQVAHQVSTNNDGYFNLSSEFKDAQITAIGLEDSFCNTIKAENGSKLSVSPIKSNNNQTENSSMKKLSPEEEEESKKHYDEQMKKDEMRRGMFVIPKKLPNLPCFFTAENKNDKQNESMNNVSKNSVSYDSRNLSTFFNNNNGSNNNNDQNHSNDNINISFKHPTPNSHSSEE